MTLLKVFDISDRNLADVPRRLRMLADELEGKAAIRSLTCIVEFAEEQMDIVAFGRDADQTRVLGILEIAQVTLAGSIVEFGYQTNGRDPDPAA